MTFPSHLCHTPSMIAALVARGQLPTTDDLEFVGMVEGGGDLIFDALCFDSGSYPSSPMSSDGNGNDESCESYLSFGLGC